MCQQKNIIILEINNKMILYRNNLLENKTKCNTGKNRQINVNG